MKSKTVRAFSLCFLALLGLCLFWNFLIEWSGGPFDLFSFYHSLLVWYIPFAVITLGILLVLISFFLNDKIKKGFRITAGVLLGIAIIFSFTMMGVGGKGALKEENIQKNTAAETKYQVQNFVKDIKLLPDTEIPTEKSEFYAMGSFFAYYTEQRYVCAEDDWFGVHLTAYEFENIPWILRGAMENHMEKKYIKTRTESGEMYGKQYACYTFDKVIYEKENRKQYNTYCAVLVQEGNHYSLFLLDTLYSKNNHIDTSKIIETLCSA